MKVADPEMCAHEADATFFWAAGSQLCATTFGARVFFFLPGHQFRSPGRRYVSKKTNFLRKKSSLKHPGTAPASRFAGLHTDRLLGNEPDKAHQHGAHQ